MSIPSLQSLVNNKLNLDTTVISAGQNFHENPLTAAPASLSEAQSDSHSVCSDSHSADSQCGRLWQPLDHNYI